MRRRQNDFGPELARKGWYHSFELPDGSRIDGCMPVEWLRERWHRFPIPADLTGKRVLDIGAWDGWFSFEAERRGAAVTSVDRDEVENYLHMHRRLGSRADYRTLDVYELPEANLGAFDITFFLGVLYHLKHPLLGLEIVCSLTTDVAIIESFVTDGANWREHADDIPSLEFYEFDELNGHLDNWCGPTVGCLLALCRAAGFARVELLAVDAQNASLACYRRWKLAGAATGDAPELLAAGNPSTGGINFYPKRDEYVACWFRAPGPVTRGQLRLEIGEFGAPAVLLRPDGENGVWLAQFRLPPGTPAGWNRVRLRLENSAPSAAIHIAVNMPVRAAQLEIKDVFDGATWKPVEIESGRLSCWVSGLPENADRHNVRLWLGDLRLHTTYVSPASESGYRQVNGEIPADCPKGERAFSVECGGVRSQALQVRLC